jgi:hypothetical protein
MFVRAVCVAAGLIFLAGNASSQASSTRKPHLEQYSALEDEGGLPPVREEARVADSEDFEEVEGTVLDTDPAAMPQAPGASAQAHAVRAARPAAPAAAPVEDSRQPNEPASLADSFPYDPVPAAEVSSIRQRVHLVDLLLRKYGRAYDYRTHPVRELKAVLADLDAQAKAWKRSQHH